MEVGNTFVFQTDSSLIAECFESNKNYKIQYAEKPLAAQKYCAIYFASNNIYFPNDAEVFRKEIEVKDKYEWFGTRIQKAEKHIFIRDVKKQWYLAGVNSEMNSIEKVFEFLKKETQGYDVITLGSSAGGYAAVLFGSMLKAHAIYSFNGQMELSSLLESSSEATDPIIFRQQNNPAVNKYYSLVPYIQNPESVYYFCSINSKWDYEQQQHIQGIPINAYYFNTSHHGIPFLKTSLGRLLNLDRAKLFALKRSQKYNPLLFSYKIEGAAAFYNMFLIVWNKFVISKLKRLTGSK
jgi:hypothetical protein